MAHYDGTRFVLLLLLTLLVFCALIGKGAALDLNGKPTRQSSTYNSLGAGRAIDGIRNTHSHTKCSPQDQWWLIDLQEIYCLTKITIVNRQDNYAYRLESAIVRAGMNSNPDHTSNAMIGSAVTQTQASSREDIEFVSGDVFMAQYVSVDLPAVECLQLAEVQIDEIVDTVQTVPTTGISLDATVVVDPAVIGDTGDDDAVMAVYKGPDAITAGVSFGRQLTTDQGTTGLPSGSVGKYDQSLGCQTRLLTLPESAGLDRTGVFYAVASKNDVATKIQTIILPSDQGAIHVSPVKRTQIANAGDSVLLLMRHVNSPNTNYRWRHKGDIITSWDGQLNVTIMNVSATDKGVYTCFAEGHENDQLHGIMRLIVRDCPKGVWGPSCLRPCRRCYNGGICDDQTGSCTCPPGFSGESCERVHGRDVFGKTASHSCSNGSDPHSTDCRDRLFCLPDPYGCSCAAGYKGLDCTQECDEGLFGADCQQTCNCVQGDTCLKDTGQCTGECKATFSGANCQCSTQLATLGFTVLNDDPNLLKVSWQSDPCTIGHKLQYELVKRGKHEVIEDPRGIPVNISEGVTQCDLTGLESCSMYNVSIQPRYSNGDGPTVLKSLLTLRDPDEPTTVTPLMRTSGNTTSFTLEWSSVFCSDYYDVQYAVTNRYGCETVDNVEYKPHCMCLGNQNTTVISGLTANSMYNVKVQAQVDDISGVVAELQDILTSTAKPSTPPGSVASSSISQRSLSFTWTQPECSGRGGVITMYGYQLQGSDTIQNSTSGESVTIFDLIPYTNYTFRVAAHTSAGGGPFSQDLVVRTNEAEPTVPLNVQTQDVDDASISLTWSRPDPPHGIITQYNVRYWKAGQTDDLQIVNDIKQLEYTIGRLETNITYSIQVRAETSVGVGPWSDAIIETTVIGVPGRVQGLRLVEVTENSVELDWNQPLNPRGEIRDYIVEYKVLQRPGQSDFVAMDAYDNVTTEDTSITKEKLDPGTKYEFRVSARNTLNTGEPSSLDLYTKPLSVPPKPEQPIQYPKEATDTTVTIGLNSLTGNDAFIDSYVVQVKKVSTSSVTKREAFIPSRYEDSPDNYIAAEFSKQDVPDKFTVGDNTTQGGYLNAPLQRGANYEIRVGSVSKGNESVGFVTYSPQITVTAKQYSSTNGGLIAALVVVSLLIVAVGIGAAFFLYKRRRSSQDKMAQEGQGSFQSVDRLQMDPVDETKTSKSNAYDNDVASDTAGTKRSPPPPKPQPRSRTKQKAPQETEEPETFTQPPPIPVQDLAEYIHQKDLAGENGFPVDYKSLPDDQLHPWTVASISENRAKNRYVNVIAYDHSRVVLESLEGDPHSDYINACYIDGYKDANKYIASQGPNNASLKDIWRMVWQLNVDKIVMLTNPIENGKTKCLQYWADEGSKTYSDIVVTTVNETVFLDYTIRKFCLNKVNSDDTARVVTQFHYTTWPDMKPPDYPAPVLNFLRVLNNERNKGRTVIHCSAGVGRTGTLIALDTLLEQMAQEGQVDVFGCIYRMRQQRIKMVQTKEQYRFLFDALLAAYMTGNTTYKTTDIRKMLTSLKSKKESDKETDLFKQFQTMGKISKRQSRKTTGKGKSGELPENLDRNRFPDFIPSDFVRPFMTTMVNEDDTNYINATFLPGYHKRKMYIATQMPMPKTIADIWRLVYDQKCTCIVMLNSLDENDESMCRYWPEEGSIAFGHLDVELLRTNKRGKGVIERTFSLTNTRSKHEAKRTIHHFQYMDWPTGQEVPSSLDGMVDLMSATHIYHQDNVPMVVHCIDGLGRSSVYCTVMALMEQSMTENVVDVFQAAHRLRMVNDSMMYSKEHYALCYDIIQARIDSATIYENL